MADSFITRLEAIKLNVDRLYEDMQKTQQESAPETDKGTTSVKARSKPNTVKDIPLEEVTTAVRESIRIVGRDPVLTVLKQFKATNASSVQEKDRVAFISALKELVKKDD